MPDKLSYWRIFARWFERRLRLPTHVDRTCAGPPPGEPADGCQVVLYVVGEFQPTCAQLAAFRQLDQPTAHRRVGDLGHTGEFFASLGPEVPPGDSLDPRSRAAGAVKRKP